MKIFQWIGRFWMKNGESYVKDMFVALSCDRVYKKAWPLKDVLSCFQEAKGGQFDPDW